MKYWRAAETKQRRTQAANYYRAASTYYQKAARQCRALAENLDAKILRTRIIAAAGEVVVVVAFSFVRFGMEYGGQVNTKAMTQAMALGDMGKYGGSYNFMAARAYENAMRGEQILPVAACAPCSRRRSTAHRGLETREEADPCLLKDRYA